MSVSRHKNRLLYKICNAYYVEKLTQDQIAGRFGISRIKVSRLLNYALKENIVRITIMPPADDYSELEHELERKYGLVEAIVVSVSNPKNSEEVSRELGLAAAECLERRISGNEIIGISWGTTVMSVVNNLSPASYPGVTFVQTTGGLGPVDSLEHSAELIRRAAQKLNAKFRLLNAPGIVSTKKAADVLKSDRYIKETLSMASNAKIAIVGLGILSAESVLMRDGSILTRADVKALSKSKAVGDVALRYIDNNGKLLNLEINDRIIGLTLEQLQKIPCVIAVAGGEKKTEIIRSSLIGKIPNVLVTDYLNGKRLIS